MPAGQPFTALCQALSRGCLRSRADLHLHSTCSDGTYTPAQLVELARRCGLSAIALTDHDTLAGVPLARAAAADSGLEIIPAVEITTEYQDRELHLLAYWIDEENGDLQAALAQVRHGRVERFAALVEALRRQGLAVDDAHIDWQRQSLGRRYLAEVLVAQGLAGSIREVFGRWLSEAATARFPKYRLPIAQAIALVRRAGGVAALAHPAYHDTHRLLGELTALGLGAVEAEYPDFRRSQSQQLRRWAAHLGLAISGGSDCHGPGRRGVGSCTISDQELRRLRQQRGEVCSVPSTKNSSKA
jgi:predicted metal-dependent phosphoesterase TrpH